MSTLAANYSGVFSVVNRDVVSKKVEKRYVMSAIQFEPFSLQGSLQNIPQLFSALVSFSVAIGHNCLQIKKPHRIEIQQGSKKLSDSVVLKFHNPSSTPQGS